MRRNVNKNIFNKRTTYLNTSSSDKFINLKNYTKNKPVKKISQSIHSTFNSKYNETKIKDESILIFSSNKKRDYSLYHKNNNITSVLGKTHNRLKAIDTKKEPDLYDSSKLFLSVRQKKFSKNNLNISLNKSISNNYNRMKNRLFPLDIKNKNRIRLDYNPNKIYELTNLIEPKKKNRLNKSVTTGKTDEKKITGLSLYMNNYNKQRTKRINLESSVLTTRRIYGYSIRDLSYSPNQKYLNEKTRKERIPWKYQKKGIDSKLTTETIYNKYINRINKNPLNPNGNKKIKNHKKKKNLLSDTNSLINSSKDYTKIINPTERESHNEPKEKRRLSQEKRERRVNNHQRDKSNSIRNIKENNKLSTKKLNISISTKSKLKFIEQILDKGNNNFNIFDLSCLVIKEKNIKECNQNIIHKLKKNRFNVFSNKINEIKCTKCKMNFKIDIITIKSNDSNKNLFCYKINNKRVETKNNKIIISKIMS